MKTRLKEVLAVVNHKGGVGKTTTVQSLAAAIVRRDKEARVLVIDLDPQMCLSKLMGWYEGQGATILDALSKQTGLPIYQLPKKVKGYNQPVTSDKGVWFCPSAKDLQNVDSELIKQFQPLLALRKCFFKSVITTSTIDGIYYEGGGPTVPEIFDYVIIDCPPALSRCTYNAMAVANGLLIPTTLEGLATNGIGSIIVEMRQVKEELNPQLELIGVLPIRTDMRKKTSRKNLAELYKQFGDQMLLYEWYKGDKRPKTGIPTMSKIDEAQTNKLSIYDWKPNSIAGMAYERLMKTIFNY